MRRLAVIILTIGSMACAAKTPEPDNSAAWRAKRAAELASKKQKLEENFSRIHYHFDSDKMTDGSTALLKENAEIMLHYPELAVEVEGHCDERGSTEYNLSLGQRRAETVRKYLTTYGVQASRVSTRSLGEELPLASDQSEAAFAKNRRAEFRVLVGQDTADMPEVHGSTN